MDLVACIARNALQKINTTADSIKINKSQITQKNTINLVLYVSFNSLSSSIGLDLCKSLHEFCERHNLNDFKLIIRIS